MDFGIEVVGDSGNLQIDSTWGDMVVVHEGSTTPAIWSQNTPSYIDLPTNMPSSSLLFYRPRNTTNPYATCWGYHLDNRIWFYHPGGDFASGIVDYRICALENSVPELNEAYGLQVWNEETDLVFSSRRPSRVKVGQAFTFTGFSPGPFVADVGNGRTAWVACTMPFHVGYQWDQSVFPAVIRKVVHVFQFNYLGANTVYTSSYYEGAGWTQVPVGGVEAFRPFMYCYF